MTTATAPAEQCTIPVTGMTLRRLQRQGAALARDDERCKRRERQPDDRNRHGLLRPGGHVARATGRGNPRHRLWRRVADSRPIRRGSLRGTRGRAGRRDGGPHSQARGERSRDCDRDARGNGARVAMRPVPPHDGYSSSLPSPWSSGQVVTSTPAPGMPSATTAPT